MSLLRPLAIQFIHVELFIAAMDETLRKPD
jgi:hypothetical protein